MLFISRLFKIKIISFTCFQLIYHMPKMKQILLSIFIAAIFCSSCIKRNKSEFQVLSEPIEINTNASLRGLSVVNEKVVWVSGSNGTVLHTVDGGKNWNVSEIEGENNNDFRSIHAWNENEAIVFGVKGPAFAYKTTDGGKQWQVVFRDISNGLFFNSLKFADKNNGLAVSDPIDKKFFILKTEDAGNSWERILNIPDALEGEANFAASNTCIEFLPTGKAWIASGGKAARVFYSKDFGNSWQVSKTPIIRGQASAGIFSISFRNDSEGIIVGGIYDEPQINQNIAAYTVDGGETWLPAQNMPREYRSCVQHISFQKNNFSFANGKTGCDISFDGGINWQAVDTSGFYTFRQVPNKNIGFASGAKGKILKLTFNL